jgi:hypothetical protein
MAVRRVDADAQNEAKPGQNQRAKRWTTRTVPVDEVRMLRGVKGEEDTAIIVTTGRFVYLIDGDKLIEICKRNQIGVKKVPLPDLLVLDPEVARESSVREDHEAAAEEAEPDGSERVGLAVRGFRDEDGLSGRRFRDEMLGDPERGLTVEEVAELSGYRVKTVRVYLADDQQRKVLGDAIRGNQKARKRALAIVSSRRESEPPE